VALNRALQNPSLEIDSSREVILPAQSNEPKSLNSLLEEVSFPQRHPNMRRVRPSFGLVMLTMSSVFARQCRQRTTSACNGFEL
jgi:hypothetical protein